MSQFFISCKESRIENNRSFYGCFYLGPFEPSQSITIANALRRTLLSELYGVGIISVEIEGATHEYSSLPGVRDSVLDILLNLKEIVLKKTMKNFKPQIGYLRARGPGVIRASHLRLPPFIQCVDPDQYIATLADNGFLNLKFIIQYGNKWLSPQNNFSSSFNLQKDTDNKKSQETNPSKPNYSTNSAFNLHLKKRRLILTKLKHMSFEAGTIIKAHSDKNTYLNMFSQSTLFLSKYTKKRKIAFFEKNNKNIKEVNGALFGNKKYPAVNFKNSFLKKLSKSIEKAILPTFVVKKELKKAKKQAKKENLHPNGLQRKKTTLFSSGLNQKRVFLNANPLTIEAVFNPINKVNYIIETNDFKKAPLKMQTSFETSELYEMLKKTTSTNEFLNTDQTPLKEDEPLLTSKNPSAPQTDSLNVENSLKKYMQNQSLLEQQGASLLKQFPNGISQEEFERILELKSEVNALKKDSIKHTIILECWTNGSIHPRDALYQAFKNLIQLFSKLKKINTFGVNQFLLHSLSGLEKLNTNQENDSVENISFSLPLPFLNKKEESTKKRKPFLDGENPNSKGKKKLKMGEITSTLLQDLLPLNETSFLSTYVAPKLKNYYLNNQSLSLILKNPVLKRQTEPIFLQNTTINDSNLLKTGEHSKETKKTLEPLKNLEKNILARQADIGILNLSLRSYTSLKRLKINTIEEFFEFYQNDASNLTKLSKTSVEEIGKALEKIGSSFQLNIK